jgi:hypothetical protein
MQGGSVRSDRKALQAFHEPTLSEILSDSIVEALMNADGVDPVALEAMLRQMAAGDHAPIAPDSEEVAVYSKRRAQSLYCALAK